MNAGAEDLRTRGWVWATGLAALLFCGGCAGNKACYKQADRTGTRIAKFRSEVVAIKGAVEETVYTLGDVINELNSVEALLTAPRS